MSLESEIKRLNENLETLMERIGVAVAVEEPKEEPTKAPVKKKTTSKKTASKKTSKKKTSKKKTTSKKTTSKKKTVSRKPRRDTAEPKDEKFKEIQKRLKELGRIKDGGREEVDAILEYFEIDSVRDLPSDDFDSFLEEVEASIDDLNGQEEE